MTGTTVSPEVQDVIDALAAVADLLRNYGGEAGDVVAVRVEGYRAHVAAGDIDTLGSVLADTTGGMGSLRDVALTPPGGRSAQQDEWTALQERALSDSALAAEKCRIAMRQHGLEVWR